MNLDTCLIGVDVRIQFEYATCGCDFFKICNKKYSDSKISGALEHFPHVLLCHEIHVSISVSKDTHATLFYCFIILYHISYHIIFYVMLCYVIFYYIVY